MTDSLFLSGELKLLFVLYFSVCGDGTTLLPMLLLFAILVLDLSLAAS